MKKIDFNIELPQKDVFDELKFKKENPELYVKYTLPPTKETIMEQIQTTIESMLMRSLNKVKIDKKDFIEKPTVSSDMKIQRKYTRVIDAIEIQKDGWAKLEDADFEFLKSTWDAAEMPVYKNTAKNLSLIDEAIEIAALKKGNPDK